MRPPRSRKRTEVLNGADAAGCVRRGGGNYPAFASHKKVRSRTIAFLIGVLVLQSCVALPDPRWTLLAPPVVVAALRYRPLRLPAFALCGLLWALWRAGAFFAHALPADLEGRDVEVTGHIASIPQPSELGSRFEFDVETLRYRGVERTTPRRIRLSWYGTAPELRCGERRHLEVRLKRPRGLRNPGGFDYERWLYQRGIGATGYVRRALDEERPQEGYRLARLRQRLGEAIAGALRDRPYAAVIGALAIGERGPMTARQWEVLRATGTGHLLAISGLHIGLVAALAFLLVRRLWAAGGRAPLRLPAPSAAALAAIAAAAGYSAMAGFSIPTQRALVMVVVVMLAQVLQRQSAPSHSLALALLAVLILDPTAVLAPGFWLSYAAVGVILFGMSARWSAARRGWWRWGRVHGLVAVGLLPFTLLLFQSASLVAPVTNLLAVPWVSLLVVPLTLAGALLLWVAEPLGTLLLVLAERLSAVLFACLEWCAALPFAYWSKAAAPLWSVPLALLGTLLLCAPRGLPARWLGVLLAAPFLVCVPPRPEVGAAWLTLLDVGQGLSAVVRTHHHALVFDTGPSFGPDFDTGEAVVLPYLRQAGVRRLDVLMISHGDNDHIGGARSVLQGMPVARVISSVPRRLERSAPGAHAQHCDTAQRWRWDGVEFAVLHPEPGAPTGGNDGSCVLRVTGAGGSLLLTGDIERGAEEALLARDREALEAAVVVAPHHGSKTSSTPEWVGAVAPRYVLFPVGYRNRFGFPHPAVLRRYRDAGARLFDTAAHGAVTVRIDAAGIAAPEAYRPAARRYWNAP